jgi:hypothetical protein
MIDDLDWAHRIESVLGQGSLPASLTLKTNVSTCLHGHVGYADGQVDRPTPEQALYDHPNKYRPFLLLPFSVKDTVDCSLPIGVLRFGKKKKKKIVLNIPLPHRKHHLLQTRSQR